jgi:hypothetical protein
LRLPHRRHRATIEPPWLPTPPARHLPIVVAALLRRRLATSQKCRLPSHHQGHLCIRHCTEVSCIFAAGGRTQHDGADADHFTKTKGHCVNQQLPCLWLEGRPWRVEKVELQSGHRRRPQAAASTCSN